MSDRLKLYSSLFLTISSALISNLFVEHSFLNNLFLWIGCLLGFITLYFFIKYFFKSLFFYIKDLIENIKNKLKKF